MSTPVTPDAPGGPDAAQAPGRRTASRAGAARGRVDRIVVLAVLLPLLTLLAALGVHAAAEPSQPHAAAETPLDRATVICPSGGTSAAVTTLTTASGDVSARAGARAQRPVAVTPHATTVVKGGSRSLVVGAEGDLAPGLVAGSFATPLASADCRAPAADQWFTGVGAAARHHSYLELVNPDAGRALVDVQVLGHRGLVDAPQLRGVAVPGGQDVRLDLGQVVPRRDDLALHVTTIRGRVLAAVADSFDELGGGAQGADWLPAQAAPSTTNLMLGLPTGVGQRTLVLANPGDSEGRATVRLVSPQSTFTPEGMRDVVLPPQSVVRVSLTDALGSTGTGGTAGTGRSDAAERPLGVEVDSTVPATAGMLLFIDGDLAHASPLAALPTDGAALLPKGRKQLLLSGATGPGALTVWSWTRGGRALKDVRLAVQPGRGFSVDLPPKARLVSVRAERTSFTGAVLVTGHGVTEVALHAPATTGLVPDVRPGVS